MNKKLTAYIMLTLSSFIFGFSFLFTKETLQNLGIFQLLGLRFLVAAVIMGLLAVLGLIKIRLSREKIKSLALLTFFQPILYFIGETYGIKFTSASESGMMIALMPIAIALFSRAILKEKLVFHQWAAIAASVAGMALIIGAKGFEPGSGSLIGYLFLLCAITAEGVYSPLTRKLSSQCSPIEITFAIMITGAVVFNAIGLTIAGIDGKVGTYFSDAFNFQTAEGILYLSVLSSIAAFFMYNYALSKVKASTSASFCNLTTVISVLAGVTIGGEKLYTMQIAGMLMILLSIWGILSERPLISKTAGNYKSMEGKEFIIKKYNCADPGVISDVKSFTQECTRIEGVKSEILPEASMNFKDGMPCLFTCELNGKLIGVLNIFAPGPFEAEIGALVHPDYRRRGVFKALLREALRDISRYGYRRGLFVCDVSFDSGTKIAEKLRLKRDHGEFHMTREIEELEIDERLSDITIAEAGENDLDELTELGTEVFDIDEISERQLLLRTLGSPDRVQWAVKKDDKIVGLCGIRIKSGECMVFGLGIHPEERRKGYAYDLLAFVACYAGKKGAKTLSLDVDSENAAAISLYEGFGLKRALETDYYIFTFRGIKKFLRPRKRLKE